MPDAILLDCHIPPMATVEFLSSLRALAQRQQAHRHLLRHREQFERDHASALSAGADDYVMKPFDRESLRAKLAATGLV